MNLIAESCLVDNLLKLVKAGSEFVRKWSEVLTLVAKGKKQASKF